MDFETPSHSPPQINVNPQRREPSDGFGVGGRPHLVRVGSMDFLGPASVGSYGGWRGGEGEQDNGDRGNRMGKVLSLSAKLQHFPAPPSHSQQSINSLRPTVSTAHNLAHLASSSTSVAVPIDSAPLPPPSPSNPTPVVSPNTRSRTRQGMKNAAESLLEGAAELQGKAKAKDAKKGSKSMGRRKSEFKEPQLPASRLRSSTTSFSPPDHSLISNSSSSSSTAKPTSLFSTTSSPALTTPTPPPEPPRRQGLRSSTTIKRSNSLYYVRAACNNSASSLVCTSSNQIGRDPEGKGKGREEPQQQPPREELVDVEMGESSSPSSSSSSLVTSPEEEQHQSSTVVRVVKHKPHRLVRSQSHTQTSTLSSFGSSFSPSPFDSNPPDFEEHRRASEELVAQRRREASAAQRDAQFASASCSNGDISAADLTLASPFNLPTSLPPSLSPPYSPSPTEADSSPSLLGPTTPPHPSSSSSSETLISHSESHYDPSFSSIHVEGGPQALLDSPAGPILDLPSRKRFKQAAPSPHQPSTHPNNSIANDTDDQDVPPVQPPKSTTFNFSSHPSQPQSSSNSLFPRSGKKIFSLDFSGDRGVTPEALASPFDMGGGGEEQKKSFF